MRAVSRTVIPAAVTVLAVTATGTTAMPANARDGDQATMTNPVSAEIADTWADPVVIKGKDGLWYSYATSDPRFEGDTEIEPMHIARSHDLVDWEYVGNVFDEGNRPTWVGPTSFFWAPDIRYVDGRYLLYFTATNTNVSPGDGDGAIGVATAPTPAGPWTDSGALVVPPRPAPGGGWLWTFDPSMLTDTEGRRWLYYGSYFGGVFVTELTSDGLRAVGEPTQVTIDNRYEGAYVVRQGGHYYLFASSANCCAGPTTGYSVYAGRSTDPRGPFVDAEGTSLLESRVGGTPVISPNGNAWVGTGHNAVVTDVSGQTWLAYHAIDRADPYLNGTDGINERPMLLDRLDWIDGWPTVRAGAWASEGSVPAPVTSGPVDADFDDRRPFRDWLRIGGRWDMASELGPGRYATRREGGRDPGFLLSRARVSGDVRVEADLRTDSGHAGLVVRYHNPRNHVVAWVDPTTRQLVIDVTVGGRTTSTVEPLPMSFDPSSWHTVAAELRGTDLVVDVTGARLADPYAVVHAEVAESRRDRGRVGVAARDGSMDADNVATAALPEPVTEPVPLPTVGTLDPAYSDEFDGELGPGWTWVRQDPDAIVAGDVLRWPTQAADLVGPGNQAGVLLRDAPDGDYVVETKLTVDLGTDTVRNFQQGGLVAYLDDDEFLRLSHVAIWNTRQAEFGKEMPYAGRLQFGGMIIGPPADTTWLRLAHTVDPENGEHEFRAATSRDGEIWIWGGTWTLPAGDAPRIGVISHGGDNPQATSEFDYVRAYR
ncbi:MAG: family 43 glycosylhydrolase [Jiangellaceae bacterium]